MSGESFDFVVIGGGAAGFFAALSAKAASPHLSVLLLEKSGSLLSKVKVSGGGRCNVTHACFDPKQLILNYPRGSKSLLGPFTRFQPKDTIEWFAKRGVELKTEPDGRMFPTTDSSQTIIDCLTQEAKKLSVEIRLLQHIESIEKMESGFEITLKNSTQIKCRKLLLATGSNPQGLAFAKQFGHTLEPPVPSLFTFNIPNSPLKDLAGIAIPFATLSLVDSPFSYEGALLITHWGFSGPAVLKLSAWGARFLHEREYKAQVKINWLGSMTLEEAKKHLHRSRLESPSQTIGALNPFLLPKNLWKRLVGLEGTLRMSGMSNEAIEQLSRRLVSDIYVNEGKTTNKEEFVTCGGVCLNEVSFKTMESRVCPGLYFAGEILDIDGITGGFNFQAAWTTAWTAGQAQNL